MISTGPIELTLTRPAALGRQPAIWMPFECIRSNRISFFEWCSSWSNTKSSSWAARAAPAPSNATEAISSPAKIKPCRQTVDDDGGKILLVRSMGVLLDAFRRVDAARREAEHRG